MTGHVGCRCIVVGDIYNSFSNQISVLTETDVIERISRKISPSVKLFVVKDCVRVLLPQFNI
jgi:hypothetical protein